MTAMTHSYSAVTNFAREHGQAEPHPQSPSNRQAGRQADDPAADQPAEPLRIFVASSDPKVAELVPACLRLAGYPTEIARTGAESLAQVEQSPPSLLTLDTALPDTDGFALARQIRLQLGLGSPILFLASAAEANASTMALTMGDDYLIKPFCLDDLTASVRALLRRTAAPGRRPESLLRFADLEFNEETLHVHRGRQIIYLTPQERRILRHLLINSSRVVTRAELIAHVWPYGYTGHRRVIDVHLCNLRNKINDAGPPLIHTLHGVGYLLRAARARS